MITRNYAITSSVLLNLLSTDVLVNDYAHSSQHILSTMTWARERLDRCMHAYRPALRNREIEQFTSGNCECQNSHLSLLFTFKCW